MRDLVLLGLVHLRIRLALVLEDGVPACISQSDCLEVHGTVSRILTEVRGSASRYDFPLPIGSEGILQLSSFQQRQAYCGSALEDDGSRPRTSRVGKRADGLGRLVFVCHEKVVQPVVAESRKEPLSAHREYAPVTSHNSPIYNC